MAPILIVYYSRTGSTDALAHDIAAQCDSDIFRLSEPAGSEHNPGVFGFFKSLKDALYHEATEIVPLPEDKLPSKYKLVVVGTPVWMGVEATPVRKFLEEYKGQFPSLAFFCSGGTAEDHTKMWEEMEQLAGRKAEAVFGAVERDVVAEKFGDDADAFIKKLTAIADKSE